MSQFNRVQVHVNLKNDKIIHWIMNGMEFKPTGTVSFYIDKARGGGEWAEIAGPIEDDCFYIDTVKWNWNKDKNTYYRVRFRDAANNWVYSTPTIAYEHWSDEDYRLAKEICRKEYLYLRKAGQQGVYLSRKEWGTPCPNCRDWDLRDTVNTMCEVCFGVGIVGGYYAPLDMPAVFTPYATKRDLNAEGIGVQQPDVRNARVVLYPWVKSYDLWMDVNTGDRYSIQTIQVVAEMKGVPLVGMIMLRKLPKSDVVFSEAMNIKASTPPAPAATGTEYTWDKGLDCKDDY